MSRRNYLFLAMLIALVASSAVYGQDWVSKLNLSSGEYSRKISLLNFDSTNSNLSSYQASRVMDGFFSGLDSQGSYRIKLKREYVRAKGDDILPVIAGIGFALFGCPIQLEEYKLIVHIEIRDLKGNLVQTVTRSENYTIDLNLYNALKEIKPTEMSRMSKIFSSLIRQARNDINYEATAINNRLRSAAQSFDKNFDELSASLRRGTSVAILPISGSDIAENNRVLSELMRYFLNSSKKYVVVNREHIDKVVAEIAFQRSLFVDKNTAVRIGEFVGAKVIIVSRVDNTNNGKQLVMQAIDVETTRTVGTSFVIY